MFRCSAAGSQGRFRADIRWLPSDVFAYQRGVGRVCVCVCWVEGGGVLEGKTLLRCPLRVKPVRRSQSPCKFHQLRSSGKHGRCCCLKLLWRRSKKNPHCNFTEQVDVLRRRRHTWTSQVNSWTYVTFSKAKHIISSFFVSVTVCHWKHRYAFFFRFHLISVDAFKILHDRHLTEKNKFDMTLKFALLNLENNTTIKERDFGGASTT